MIKKEGILLVLKNGKKYLCEADTFEPVVYLPVLEKSPPAPTWVNSSKGESDEDQGPVMQQRPEIIVDKFWTYYVTINGTEAYVPMNDVEAWFIVKYARGASVYFVYSKTSKGKEFRENIEIHI